MRDDPNANQGRGPAPRRVSLGEAIIVIVCMALLGWVVLAVVGAPS